MGSPLESSLFVCLLFLFFNSYLTCTYSIPVSLDVMKQIFVGIVLCYLYTSSKCGAIPVCLLVCLLSYSIEIRYLKTSEVLHEILY